ncbi:hypothetical protein P3H15_51795 [Rhodococcus sp. T2V]|uniref:hypothetical protein n=1 Tax=Rhodococcus sp. T2V TaxID=3034164 RepID=UPI0023E1078E|nr:hypothetical protein [Rhodococcus sp. T2V]MDF3313396.1 hypothetical protein [Rhodococcus sp. T2V]
MSLLCYRESVVRCALAGTTQPIAVSRYDLSPAEQAALPAEDALTRAVALELDDHSPESAQPHQKQPSRGGSDA